MRDSLGDDEKEQVRKNEKNRKMDERSSIVIMSKCVV